MALLAFMTSHRENFSVTVFGDVINILYKYVLHFIHWCYLIRFSVWPYFSVLHFIHRTFFLMFQVSKCLLFHISVHS
jgi:hypothetical protein